MHSTTTKVIEIMICVRLDSDTTTTKNWHVHFCSRRTASNGSRHTRYVI